MNIDMLLHHYTHQELNSVHKRAIFSLWNNEYPLNLKLASIDELDGYLDGLISPLHMFLYEKDEIIAWTVTFLRNGETWFVLIIDNNYQGKGLGGKIMEYLKTNNSKLTGWVIDSDKFYKDNGTKYCSPMGFYLKNQIRIVPGRLETEVISAAKITFP